MWNNKVLAIILGVCYLLCMITTRLHKYTSDIRNSDLVITRLVADAKRHHRDYLLAKSRFYYTPEDSISGFEWGYHLGKAEVLMEAARILKSYRRKGAKGGL